MTLFEAKEYDPSVEKRRRMYAIAGLVLAAFFAFLVYHFWDWREEHAVSKFLTAIEHKDYERAYTIWNADPNWKQHPQKFTRYPYAEFYQDWGPGGEWGLVNSYHVEGSDTPKGGSGVVVVVTVNHRSEPARLWVEKSDKTLTFSPY